MTLQQLSLFTENRNPNHPPTVYSGTHVIAQKRVTEDSVMLRSLKKKRCSVGILAVNLLAFLRLPLP